MDTTEEVTDPSLDIVKANDNFDSSEERSKYPNGTANRTKSKENGSVPDHHVPNVPAQPKTSQTLDEVSGSGFLSDSGRSSRELNGFPTISSSTGLSRDFGNDSEVDELKDSSEEDPLILTPWQRRSMLIILCMIHFYYGAYYAMLGAFFPATVRTLTNTKLYEITSV